MTPRPERARIMALSRGCVSHPFSARDLAAVDAQLRDPLPSWNEATSKKAITDFVARVTKRAGRTSCRPPNGSRRSTTTARCGPSSRSTSRSLSRSTASRRWRRSTPSGRQTQPFKGVLEGDMKAVAASGEQGLLQIMAATHAGNTTEEFERIVKRLDRDGPASEDEAALHRHGVPADAGAAGLPARERVQDVHRVRRRRRVHAALGRARVRHSARAGRRQPSQGEVRGPQRRRQCWCGSPRSISSTTRPASRSASTGHRPPADRGIRQLGRRFRDARVDHVSAGPTLRPHRPSHRRASANGPTIARRTSVSSRADSTRRRSAAGSWWT